MYCSNCGTELREGVAFCPTCGQPVNGGQAGGTQSNSAQQGAASNPDPYTYGGGTQSSGQTNADPYQYGGGNSYNGGNGYQKDPYQYQQQPPRQDVDGFAIASLILGIISFFLFPIIGAILAIVFGNKSIRENGMNTMARVGKILGIVSLAIYIVVIIIMVIAFTMIGVGSLYYF